MAADIRQAKLLAANMLNRYNFRNPPVDPRIIAEAEGIRVFYTDFTNHPGLTNHQNSLGFFDPTEKTDLGNGAIIINHNIFPQQKIYAIAYELGRALMYYSYENKQAENTQHECLVKYPMNNCENNLVANKFAVNLLMPAKWVAKFYFMIEDVGRIPTSLELATYFNVSIDNMRNRLQGMDFE